ncbi:MAG: ABC transporter ATP-binding protein [Bacteroidales bacterium]|nr:ABC transporter ATP-binding protein [Bacteroidales bacterium]
MKNVIEIQQLVKSFGKTRVLEGIDLNFEASRISVVLGPNGSGKTTMIKSVLGMVIPNSGSIKVLGTDIQGQWDYRKNISYLPQIANFPPNLTALELVNMLADLRGGNQHTRELIERFGLGPFMRIRLSNLSGGTRQKVNILLAFMSDAPVIILDEPTNGLDPVALIRLKSLIAQKKSEGRSFLITTHIMQLVEELADEIVFLLEGKIYFKGTVSELKGTFNENNIEKAIARILLTNNVA